jgi:hypothetical protein
MVVVIPPASTKERTMTDKTTTTTSENIHRTPALDKMGLARCRKDNKLFSWRKGGSCKVCGARVEDAPTAPTTAPAPPPKRGRKAAAAVTPITEAKPKRGGSGARSAKKKA